MLVIVVAGGSGGTRLVRRGLLDVLSTIGELLLILSVLVRSLSPLYHIHVLPSFPCTCAHTHVHSHVYIPLPPPHTHMQNMHTLTLT